MNIKQRWGMWLEMAFNCVLTVGVIFAAVKFYGHNLMPLLNHMF